MTKASDNPYPSILVAEQVSAPATPASGYGRIYCKSTGLFFIGDDGVEIGPLGAGGTGSLSVATTTIQARVTLYDNILGGAGTWDVSSIDQTYDHLELMLIARGTHAAAESTLGIALNNDTTDANYRVSYHVSSASQLQGIADSRGMCAVPGNTSLANYFGTTRITIADYTKTTCEKMVLIYAGHRADATTISTENRYIHWENTGAINRIAIAGLDTANLAANSRLIITGIKELSVVTGVTIA